MNEESHEYNFKNSGGKELNDVIYNGPPFELLYHSYTFSLTPKTRFWRFGIRLSESMVVQFSSEGRYINPQYPDLQIVVGDRPSGEWINPNKIELGNYYYLKGQENNNPFDVCNTYIELSPVTVELKHEIKDNVLLISYAAKGCPDFQKQLQLSDYKYFQIFAWADWIDFELNCQILTKDFRYLSLPTIPLTEFDVKWMKLIYEKFKNSDTILNEYSIKDLWDEFPNDYNPKGVNPLVVMGGTTITLYGIYHIDPMSAVFEHFDKIIYAIRKKLSQGKIPESISSKEINEELPDLSQHEVIMVFKLIPSFNDFSRGYSQENDSTINIHVNDSEILKHYKSYRGLEKFLDDFLKKSDVIRNQTSPTTVQPSFLGAIKAAIGRTLLKRRNTSDLNPVMGVEDVARFLAEIIESLQADKGQMIGVFAKWGRGKTFLLNQLFKLLENNRTLQRTEAIRYERVDFHAWKYQETPASWAYLYEVLADKFLGSKWPFWKYYPRLIRLNFNRQKIWPMLSFLLGLTATIATPILTEHYFKKKDSLLLFWLGITPSFLIIAFGILKQLQKSFSTKAIDLVKKYGIRHSFKGTLGMQAAIQDELIILIKTWVTKRKMKFHKILLFVEDIDRCTEDKIIENIDALRVMLENDEIAKRLIVVTAIDERILKNAIRIKYNKLSSDSQENSQAKSGDPTINELISEYLDKLFISAIKLGELTTTQKDEFIRELLADDLKNPITRKITKSSSNTDEFNGVPLDQNSTFEQDSNAPANTSTTDGVTLSPNTTLRAENKSNDHFEGLTDEELEFLLATAETWSQATPRTITIFYYRYLICKNLLLAKYDGLRRAPIWRDQKAIKGLMAAILEFSTYYDPSKILLKRQEVGQNSSSDIEIAKGHVQIEKQDYLYMLEIFDIIIAY